MLTALAALLACSVFAQSAGTAQVSGTVNGSRRVPPARVSGRMLSYDGKPLMSGAVIMAPLDGQDVSSVAPADIAIRPDGRFVFDHVSPGRYEIRARAQSDRSGEALFAVFPVEVMGSEIQGITMTLRPGALVDGRVIVDARHTKPPTLSTLRVRAPFTDGSEFGDALTGTVHHDGTFAIRGVMSGAHQFVIEGLQPPWVLKTVTLRGSDVTDLEVPVDEREQIRDLRITITDASSEVSGIVQNASNLPVASAAVIVYSKVPLFWVRTSRRMRVTYTDPDGRFTVPGLPAGEYLALASSTIDATDLARRDRLEQLRAYAVPFRLETDDGRATVTLRVTPASAR
jgi:hypothetical protein